MSTHTPNAPNGRSGFDNAGATAPASLLLPGRRSRFPVLKTGAAALLALVLAGCRFDLTPDAFDHAATVGETVRDTLTLSNPSDEPVDFSLDVNGSGLTVSPASGVLAPGAEMAIAVEADCEEPGLVDTEIAVSGWTGKQGATVGVPFALECATPIGTQLMRLEVLQGPPVFRKDYLRGTETKPVNLHRPENGAEPVPEWQSRRDVDDGSGDEYYPSKDDAWSFDNEGMVTGIWGRRAAVALTAFHEDASPPELAATVDSEELPELKRETASFGNGYETVVVFDVAPERYQRGAVLEVAMEADGVSATDTLAFFGETVEPLMVTWIPIETADFPGPEIDAEFYMAATASWLPVAETVTGVGPTMTYEEVGGEKPGRRYDIVEAAEQLGEHRARHACGYDEIYIGLFNNFAMFNAEDSSGAIGYAGPGIIGSTIIHFEDEEILPLDIHHMAMLNAHELGHYFHQSHVPGCHMRGATTVDYPYPEGKVGPARGWDWISMQFAERDEHLVLSPRHLSRGISDFMMACGVEWVVSDFSYQLMALYRQSPEAERATGCDVGTETARLVTKSTRAVAAPPPRSIALAGTLSDEGLATITLAELNTNAPWRTPRAGRLTLEVLDAGGSVLHREPLTVSHAGHDHGRGVGDRTALWSTRVPYRTGAETVVLRGAAGDVLAEMALNRD